MGDLRITCDACGAVWWLDYDPPACTCVDGDGDEWRLEEGHRG